MNNTLRHITALACLTLVNLTAAADRFQYGDLWFVTTSSSTCEVTSGPYTFTQVTIPEQAVCDGKSYKVTVIGEEAFLQCTNLTDISLPNGLTTIGLAAFRFCENLRNVDLPNSLTTIGAAAFASCTNLTSINFPSSVTAIEDCAFTGCGLKSIIIPDGITSIQGYVFSFCRKLANISLPNGLTKIDNNAFCYCPALKSIDIPESVTSIGRCAFSGCTSLTDIYNHALTPQVINSDVFTTYGNLHIRKECKETYENAGNWNCFSIIEDLDNYQGFGSLTSNTAPTHIYSLDGRHAANQPNSISIISSSNGKTRKVMKR